ncbi:hypothetical protein G6O69_36355 [Pseudenhygromyxa sp. WMMC2535]|uniref:hypothetical protein n=1 Tax=Pseudenhygromyxa sp. WMMC2535 TaxID=2712867 RepID=UPI0015519C1C|nr:hypothetical protein [Pseudenhygromyxa sp. WMMC2535]NVB43355.1 hypothetical protein [Pseudenhygromyxa sp. WMMC2535]
MARSATNADVVNVMYEQVDRLRRTIGVAPIRLARASNGDGAPRLKVSVVPGMAAKVPTSVTLKIRGEEVEIPLEACEDYR